MGMQKQPGLLASCQKNSWQLVAASCRTRVCDSWQQTGTQVPETHKMHTCPVCRISWMQILEVSILLRLLLQVAALRLGTLCKHCRTSRLGAACGAVKRVAHAKPGKHCIAAPAMH